jgi:hypothetical protein
MRWFLVLICILGGGSLSAQKYALLDMDFIHPVRYTDHIYSKDMVYRFLPIEKSKLPQFIRDLKEIYQLLRSKDGKGKAGNFEVGCVKFTGVNIESGGQRRIDYVLTSTCDNQNISVHLCDARLSKNRNAFYIKTWIKYIESRPR